MKDNYGITLIEMVIVVSIIGILGAIVYPSYLERAQRAKRTDAKAALINVAGQQERFFLKNNRFTTNLDDLGVEGTQNNFYTLTLAEDSGDSEFLATAEAIGGQSSDETCSTLSIDQLGRKSALGPGDSDTSQECWR